MENGFLVCLMIRNGRGRGVAKGMVAVVIGLRLCLIGAVKGSINQCSIAGVTVAGFCGLCGSKGAVPYEICGLCHMKSVV